MAEKTNELERAGGSDAVSIAAGARDEELAEREFEDLALDAPEETEQIKARIEATRNQMGETIDAIQERLSFANISEQVSETVSNAIETAKDTAYDATIGKAVNIMRNVGDGVAQTGAFKTVRENPFPFALIGLGAGLLAYQQLSNRGGTRRGNGRAIADRSYLSNRDDGSKFDSARHAVGSAAGRAYHGVADKANTALETVSNAAGSAYESVSGAVSDAYSNAGEVASRAYERAGEYGTLAYDKYDEYLEENPLALGAVALAVGAAVGFAIPSTRYEGELMGETRDNLMHRAQDVAGALVEKAKVAVNDASTSMKPQRVH
jgi:ElaB/YqjD/DUF883 family membrane-anchored ribosome-binding protein